MRFLVLLVPDVPFVKGKHHGLAASFVCLYIVAGSRRSLDESVHVVETCKEVVVVSKVFIVPVDGNVVCVVIGMFKNDPVPFRVAGNVCCGTSADNCLDAVVGPLHDLHGFKGFLSVVNGVQVADLPWSVHFITYTPVLYVVWFLVAVGDSKVAPVGS